MFYKFITAALMILILAGCSQQNGPIKSMADLQERVDKLSALSRDVDGKRGELYTLIRSYNSQLPEDRQFDVARMDTTIGASEQELLRTMFKNEEDITYNGLLKTIIAKNKEIGELNKKIAELERALPVPYTVKKGDTHYEIVMDYLVNMQGINEKEARNTAFSTAMIDDILPGNQVWLMYNGGLVGTYVTQGTAKINPVTFQMKAKKRLIERSKALGSVPASASNLAAAG